MDALAWLVVTGAAMGIVSLGLILLLVFATRPCDPEDR